MAINSNNIETLLTPKIMALSYRSVQKAYEVFNILNNELLPDLKIPSWPADMSEWSDKQRENPPLNTVIGWDKKSDDGWEEIFFLVENPSQQLKDRFAELEGQVPNSCLNGKYTFNKKLWIIGWF